jgi:spoIIIJ-associated protein
MEWVETTAATVDEAKNRALTVLGVDESDAEFEVLEEPRTGLFGRVRGEARVRARVRPTQARQKVERRDRRRREQSVDGTPSGTPRRRKTPRGPRPGSNTASDAPVDDEGATEAAGAPSGPVQSAPRRPGRQRSSSTPTTQQSLPSEQATKEHAVSAEQVSEEAVRFLDGLVKAFGLDGSTTVVANGDDLEARVAGDNLGLLVGPRGTTLTAVQDLTRVAAQRRLGDHDTRLRVDVGGYRERRQVALQSFAARQAEAVKESGVARILEPMSSADRKVIHDALSQVDGIATRSEGEDPNRRVVIAPA